MTSKKKPSLVLLRDNQVADGISTYQTWPGDVIIRVIPGLDRIQAQPKW